jgi:hypothetical protein
MPDYPPYGRMIAEWENDIGSPPTPPTNWRTTVNDWLAWREKMVQLLSIVLWPRFNPATRAWEGPADALKHDLTLADFELFTSLRPLHDVDVALPAEFTTQRALFVIEDERDQKDPLTRDMIDVGPEVTLRKYLAETGPTRVMKAIADKWLGGVAEMAGTADLELKLFMQRPRAYQMGFILGLDFTHQQAKSALTPSMVSGHCLEAMMGGVAAFYRARRLGAPAASMDMLAQHAIDVGDRRVFGGVHYPSDNISSWLTGLLLCPEVCPDVDGHTWIWTAISGGRSRVYDAIATAATAANSPYARSFELLGKLGRGEVVGIDAALAEVQPKDSQPAS